MRKLIFVDDEPRVLEGLRRMLRSQRRVWDMSFCLDGAAALEELESGPCDVIVSDMRMPGMDGAELLRVVKERHPSVVRIILSGQTDTEAALRAISVSHQFLNKPCEPAKLLEVVSRACALRDLLASEEIRRAVSRIDALPASPTVYGELMELASDGEATVDELTEVIGSDPGLSAKVLQLVNSSFFGLARKISEVREAVTYLGSNTIRNLVLSAEILRRFGEVPSTDAELHQFHATLTGRIAANMFTDKRIAARALTAGVLHDVGKLVLLTSLPEMLNNARKVAEESRRPLHVVELEMNGVTHAEIGGYLLGIWGLPLPIVEAVANHHFPARVPQEELDLPGAVHIADALAHTVAEDVDSSTVWLDREYLAGLGVESSVPEWERMARAVLEEGVERAY